MAINKQRETSDHRLQTHGQPGWRKASRRGGPHCDPGKHHSLVKVAAWRRRALSGNSTPYIRLPSPHRPDTSGWDRSSLPLSIPSLLIPQACTKQCA